MMSRSRGRRHQRVLLTAAVLTAAGWVQGSTLRAQEVATDLLTEDAALQRRLAAPVSLDDCIQVALQRNLPLANARLERDAVRTAIGAAYGGWLPELRVSSSRTVTRSELQSVTETSASRASAALVQRLPLGGEVEVGYAFDKGGEDFRGSHGGTVTWTQPLLRDAGWRTAVADVSDAQLAARAEEEVLRGQVLDVIFQVKEAYYEVLRRQQIIEANQRAIERDLQLRDFSLAKVEAKLATRRDVLSAEIILAQDRARLVTAQTEQRSALDDLRDLLGVRFATALQIQPMALEIDDLTLDEAALVQRALEHNPEILKARYDLRRDRLAMQVAGNARLPQLDVQLTYDELRDNITESATLRARRRERTWQGSVTLSYPLLNKTLANDYRATQLRYEQSRRTLLDTERDVTQQVRDAVRNIERSRERIAVLEKAIEGAREKVEFANVNFQLGRASNLDITDAQKDLLEAETDHVDELVNYRVELARLERLLGGAIQ